MNTDQKFEVIVVGGGHAGTEAALASARMGVKTLLLTHNIDTLGQMSCNPAIGGIGKGHLVKEIDALGGAMARAIDHAGIQFRILNASKGPAVQATRAQADRSLYKEAIRKILENQPNLSLFQQAVDDLIVDQASVIGVVTNMGLRFYAKAVILTVGTFLGGTIHVGKTNYSGGRAGDPPANALAKRLRELPFRVERLKTGTPPRIDSKSIDYSALEVQPGDNPVPVFSYVGSAEEHPRQIPCHIAHTTEKTHALIRERIEESAMYSGAISGVGPRYCPSIEDKVIRFSNKSSHQIFVEPEGLNSSEVYPNGISTSLAYDVQLAFVRSIPGFEHAHITRPGYAIEYDFFDPRDLKTSLETKHMDNLFFAGQINGTTGYEEAGAQGLIAGINAALKVKGQDPWTPKRSEAYIGVLIDDLITQGTQEPYRMFTSRSEYRLSLREDNADLRLTEIGRSLCLVSDARWNLFSKKREAIESEKVRLKQLWVQPNTEVAAQIEAKLEKKFRHEVNVLDLLQRPEVTYDDLMKVKALGPKVFDSKVAEQVEIQTKYAGYIDRQAAEIEKHRVHEETKLPNDLDYSTIKGLSNEVSEKLSLFRPETLGIAARIPGITPAAVSILLVHLKKRQIHVRES